MSISDQNLIWELIKSHKNVKFRHSFYLECIQQGKICELGINNPKFVSVNYLQHTVSWVIASRAGFKKRPQYFEFPSWILFDAKPLVSSATPFGILK